MKRGTDRGRKRPDDPFATRLFAPAFRSRLAAAARAIIPAQLRSQAEDMLVHGLERACERRRQFRGATDEALFAWVLRIVENHSRDLLRVEKRRPIQVNLPRVVTPDVDGTDGDELPDALEDIPAPPVREPAPECPRVRKLKAALRHLRRDQRDLLLLHYGRELTFDETAALLSVPGRSVTAVVVRARLRRAVAHLRRLVGDETMHIRTVLGGRARSRRRAA